MKLFSITIVFFAPLFFATIHPSTQLSNYNPTLFKISFKAKPKVHALKPHPSEIKNRPKKKKNISPADQQKQLYAEQMRIQKELAAITNTSTVLANMLTDNVLTTAQSVTMDQAKVTSLIYDLRHEKVTDAFTQQLSHAGKAVVEKKDLALAKEFISKCAKRVVVLDVTTKQSLVQFLQNKAKELTAQLESKKAQSAALQKTNTKTAHPSSPRQTCAENNTTKGGYETSENKSAEQDDTEPKTIHQNVPDAWDND
jgi:hypothetical protein